LDAVEAFALGVEQLVRGVGDVEVQLLSVEQVAIGGGEVDPPAGVALDGRQARQGEPYAQIAVWRGRVV